LAADVKDRLFDWSQSADMSRSCGEGLHTNNQPSTSDDVLETLGQDCSAYRLIAFAPWLGHHLAYFFGHQDRSPRRITPKHPHFRKDAIGDELLPFWAY
jgi:hypothetical protein